MKQNVTVRFDPDDLMKIDGLIELRLYEDRSQFVRSAVFQKLLKEVIHASAICDGPTSEGH